MNTVKHFVNISTQKLELIQRKVVMRINCCLPCRHFVFHHIFGSVSYMHAPTHARMHARTESTPAHSDINMWILDSNGDSSNNKI